VRRDLSHGPEEDETEVLYRRPRDGSCAGSDVQDARMDGREERSGHRKAVRFAGAIGRGG
jgi:hypothetical protein